MEEEEIVERGLIAYCIVFFSEHVVLDIAFKEQVKQIKRRKKAMNVDEWKRIKKVGQQEVESDE